MSLERGRRNPTTDGIMHDMLQREFDRRHSQPQDRAEPTHEQGPALKEDGGSEPGDVR